MSRLHTNPLTCHVSILTLLHVTSPYKPSYMSRLQTDFNLNLRGPPASQATPLTVINISSTFAYFQMDVYSFGILLCEMCIRQLPATSPQKRQEQIGRVSHTVLRNLVTTCARPDPDDRPDMAAVLREVEKLVPS